MSPRILIVEDDITAAATTQTALRQAGFMDITVMCHRWPERAASAAMDAQEARVFDVVVCDGLEGNWVGVQCTCRSESFIIYTENPERYRAVTSHRPIIGKCDADQMVAAVRHMLNLDQEATP